MAESVRGDYAAYTEVAMKEENDHFVFSCPPMKAGATRRFLNDNIQKGVVFVESTSAVDVEFWIAGPKQICDLLYTSLHEWAKDGQYATKRPITRQPERHGILHRIMDW